jgi:hypothetical protein
MSTAMELALAVPAREAESDAARPGYFFGF